MPTNLEKARRLKTLELHIGRYVWILAIAGTLIIALSLVWNITSVRKNDEQMAKIQAGIAYSKDVIYRRWNARHGGIYVPVTETTPPNPYLSGIPERDIKTPSGKKLTLMNPAYMTRQVHELTKKTSGTLGHITSLKPIRPENAADPWETKALQAFETGVNEITSLEEIDGEEYLRLMRPLIVEEGCLKCHAVQGYQKGDIRGGISVSVPMKALRDISHIYTLELIFVHLVLWFIGLGGIFYSKTQLDRSEAERKDAEEALQTAYDEVEIRVQQRTAELQESNTKLWGEIIQREKAEADINILNEHLEQKVTERTRDLRKSNSQLSDSLKILQEDEEAGRMIQFSLLPEESKTINNLEFSRFLQPSMYVSGDFLDYFKIDENHTGFYMVDVAGHGVPSAFVTLLVKTYVTTLLERYQKEQDPTILDPQRLVHQLNLELLKQHMGKHVTLFYGLILHKRNILKYVNAGQYPAPILCQDNKAELLESKGVPVGMLDFAKYHLVETSLSNTFSLVIYSDGVLDILPQKMLADKNAFLKKITCSSKMTVNTLVKELNIENHEELPDDITIFVLKKN